MMLIWWLFHQQIVAADVAEQAALGGLQATVGPVRPKRASHRVHQIELAQTAKIGQDAMQPHPCLQQWAVETPAVVADDHRMRPDPLHQLPQHRVFGREAGEHELPHLKATEPVAACHTDHEHRRPDAAAETGRLRIEVDPVGVATAQYLGQAVQPVVAKRLTCRRQPAARHLDDAFR